MQLWNSHSESDCEKFDGFVEPLNVESTTTVKISTLINVYVQAVHCDDLCDPFINGNGPLHYNGIYPAPSNKHYGAFS